MAQAKRYAKRSKNLIIAYKIYENWKMKRQFKNGNWESLHGSTHSKLDVDKSLRYINQQYQDYLQYGQISAHSIEGKRILELGFGDNVGVALRFLADGASHVACIDKFYSKRDDDQQRRIYQRLRETLNETQRARFDQAVDLSSGIEINSEQLSCIYGFDVEDCDELSESEPFDLILSRAVIQDIYNPRPAFIAMDKLLRDGGFMLHKIDLSDQGMFRDNEMNPLTFLTISESVYQRMATDSAISNRKLVNYYKALMSELRYDAKLLITDVCGTEGKGDLRPHKEILDYDSQRVRAARGFVRDIRPRLTSNFRDLSDEELMIAGVFLVARKMKERG